jgi:hypothetical protein
MVMVHCSRGAKAKIVETEGCRHDGVLVSQATIGNLQAVIRYQGKRLGTSTSYMPSSRVARRTIWGGGCVSEGEALGGLTGVASVCAAVLDVAPGDRVDVQ